MELARYKRTWGTLGHKRFQIKCFECGKWSFVKDIEEIDDETGFPHWGYPVCPLCHRTNKNAKVLSLIQKYYPEYIDEHRMYLIRRNNDRPRLERDCNEK